MSSILRALRRLEADDRSADEDTGTLHEHVLFTPRNRREPRRIALAAAALVVVVLCIGALGVAGVRLVVGTGGATPQPADAANGSAGTTKARPANVTTHTPIAAPEPGPRTAPRAPRVVAVSEAARREPVAAVEAPPPARPPAAPQSELGPVARPAAAPAPAAAQRGGAPVRVERILWHPSAEKRRAWLRVDGEPDTREVREGERVGRYAVTRIDAGSVLFRSGATELRRKLGADPR